MKDRHRRYHRKHKLSGLMKELILFDLRVLEVTMCLLYDLSKLLRKLVATVPSVTVALSPLSVSHGDTVGVSGVVYSDEGKPAPAGTEVSIVATDAAGTATEPLIATTDETGAYSASLVVAEEMAAGAVTVDVTSLGVTGTATFTRSKDTAEILCCITIT